MFLVHFVPLAIAKETKNTNDKKKDSGGKQQLNAPELNICREIERQVRLLVVGDVVKNTIHIETYLGKQKLKEEIVTRWWPEF